MRPRTLPAPAAAGATSARHSLAAQPRPAEEQLLRGVAERARDVLFRLALEPAPQFEYVSPAVLALTGYAPDDFYADPALFARIVHPDDAAALFRAGGAEAPRVVRFLRRDGATASGECAVTAVAGGEDGAVVAIEGVIRDVTARVAAEDALRASEAPVRAVIAGLPDTVFIIDGAGFYRDHIAAGGAEPLIAAGSCIGRNLAEVLPEDVAVASLRSLHTALRTDERQRLRFTLPGAGGERRFEAWFVPVQPDEVLEFVRERTEDASAPGIGRRPDDIASLERFEQQPGPRNPYRLTYRELTVLQHVARGSADKQIADELGISRYTVNKHVAAILSKMDAPSRTAAGVRAVREGFSETAAHQR